MLLCVLTRCKNVKFLYQNMDIKYFSLESFKNISDKIGGGRSNRDKLDTAVDDTNGLWDLLA